MGKTLLYIGIVGLVIIAVVLGYTIYQQQITSSLNNQSVSTNQQYITPQVSTNNSTATAPATNQLSAQEIAVLNFPGPNATDAEIRQHGELVDKLSIRASALDITNCKPNPLVFEIEEGTTFKVRNTGSVAVELVRGDKIVTVPANTEKGVKITDLAKEQFGNIGYACMDQQGPTGVIQIVAKGS